MKNNNRIEGIWMFDERRNAYTTLTGIIEEWKKTPSAALYDDCIPSAADPLDRFVLYKDFFKWYESENLWTGYDIHRNTKYIIYKI